MHCQMRPDDLLVSQLRADFALVWKTRYDRGDAGVPRIPVKVGRVFQGCQLDTRGRDAEAAEIKIRIAAGDTDWLRGKGKAYAALAEPIRSDLARSERIRAQVRAAREPGR